MKYLIVKSASTPETALLFSPIILHQSMVPRGFEVVAGGFCELRGAKANCGDGSSLSIYCHGESVSVGVKSRGDRDAGICLRDCHWPDGAPGWNQL